MKNPKTPDESVSWYALMIDGDKTYILSRTSLASDHLMVFVKYVETPSPQIAKTIIEALEKASDEEA